MKKLQLFFCLTLLFFASCEQECETFIPGECILIDLSDEYNPVCGCDGVTYTNAGHAMCVGGITDYVQGECSN